MFNSLKRVLLRLRGNPTADVPCRDAEVEGMSDSLREKIRTPRVNIDGTPMAGRHDIRGRGYGSGGGYGSKY